MSCKTITNHHPRPILSGWDIPARLFEPGGEFDYTTWRKWRGFARKGEFYDLGDATKYHGEGWGTDGVLGRRGPLHRGWKFGRFRADFVLI